MPLPTHVPPEALRDPRYWTAQDLVVLDTETTGGAPGARVFEVAAARVRLRDLPACTAEGQRAFRFTAEPTGPYFETVAEFSAVLDPTAPLPAFIAAKTGVAPADLAGKPRFAETLPELERVLRGAVPVAYNWPFDRRLLCWELARAGALGRVWPTGLATPGLDVLVLVREALKYAKGKKSLEVVAPTHCCWTPARSHRALDDVRATLHVLACCIAGLDGRGAPRLPLEAAAALEWSEKVKAAQDLDFRRYLRRIAGPTMPVYEQCPNCGAYLPAAALAPGGHRCRVWLEWPDAPEFPPRAAVVAEHVRCGKADAEEKLV